MIARKAVQGFCCCDEKWVPLPLFYSYLRFGYLTLRTSASLNALTITFLYLRLCQATK